jgi:hypothetical protein
MQKLMFVPMLKKFFVFIACFIFVYSNAQKHPFLYINKQDANALLQASKNNIGSASVFKQSFLETKKEVDAFVGKEVDVPFPIDPAGGYTHDKHKSNYTLMFNAGLLYNITGESKYALVVKNMLLKYALLNPTLKKHPQATSPFAGHLFWQALNDANWMVYAGLAYDLVYNFLSAEERNKIEIGAFKPEVDYLTKDLKDWYDRLHNHSVWASAGIGIIGLASNNKDYVDMALYGSDKSGKVGFIAQMDNLFSPDGYYTEGPYYVRYAILPYMLFANAIDKANPEMKIFEHRNSILQKALITCLQQTNSNGSFFPLNDALKEKDFTSNELVTAIDIARSKYGKDNGLLTVAKKQNRVSLDKGGLLISNELMTSKIDTYFPYKTIESKDGVLGDEGGISILRNGKGEALTSLVYKYASQGLGHGHFDRLSMNVFDQGNEVLQDYGSARFIGIEQKYGGRYLPENTKYAAQTIAHNTIVQDEISHFNGDTDLGQKYHANKLFSDYNNPNVQVVAAIEENAYKGTTLKRTLFLLDSIDGRKYIIDLFKVNAAGKHQFDLPFHYNGQVISTNFKYITPTTLETFGKHDGYEFMWKEGEAIKINGLAQFTYLNKEKFYTISTLTTDTTNIYFTRIGANDPNFNLRPETSIVFRKTKQSPIFLSVLEIHGSYDTRNEFSYDTYSKVKEIIVLQQDDKTTVFKIVLNNTSLLFAIANHDFDDKVKHNVTVSSENLQWTGPYYYKKMAN